MGVSTGNHGSSELATCSITALGFIRVLAQSAEYGFDIRGARGLLLRLKTGSIPKFTFVVDDLDISQLPSWGVHRGPDNRRSLPQLANANGFLFATLDEKIPGAYLIPA
jgi:hypothetical protein